MSNRYTGVKCPVCTRKFGERDDVVVCPYCGTPHHRACYEEHGECVHKDWHDEGKEWSRLAEKQDTPPEHGTEGDHLRCPRCGSQNPSTTLFCEVCGTQLMPLNPAERAHDTKDENAEEDPFQGARFMPYNPFMNPFGGLDPDDTIDDIPVRDLAIFVGKNTHFYLPMFKHMSQPDSRPTWNWSAFLFPQFFGFYRKMLLPSLIAMLILLPMSIPSLLLTLRESPMANAVQNLALNWEMLATLSWVFRFADWGIRAFFAAFANKWYKEHVFRTVRAIREQYGDSPDYQERLAAAGGTSFLYVVITGAILFVGMFPLVTWLMLPL